MPDLLNTSDLCSITPTLSKGTMSSATAWRVIQNQSAIQHTGEVNPGFNTITFPNRLINGTFSARVTVDREKFNDFERAPECCAHLVFRYLDPDRFYAFGIGGWGFNHSLFYRKPMMDAWRPWQTGGQYGDEKKRYEQYEFDLSIRIFGSSLDCFINNSRVFITNFPQNAHYQNGNIGFYAYEDSPVTFSKIQLQFEPLKCFIVSPFNSSFDSDVYLPLKDEIETLKIGCHHVRCHRADQNTQSEPFIRTIIQQMKSANVTVVVVPGKAKKHVPGKPHKSKNFNENVFYELGAAHAMGLPTIIFAKEYKRMPADLQHLNIITESNRLLDSVKEVLSKDEYNPVYEA